MVHRRVGISALGARHFWAAFANGLDGNGSRLLAWAVLCLALAFGAVSGSAALPSAEPIHGFGFTNAFPSLNFSLPVGLVIPDGETNRLFVLEKAGRIVVITNLASNPGAATFLDLRHVTWMAREAGLLGLAFHPDFASNGRLFVFRTVIENGLRTKLSEFHCDPGASYVLASTEKTLISQLDGADTHNAGEIRFGPDGYLYLSLGDELPQFPDTHDQPQAIDKGFFGGIIRIDVDQREGSLPPNPHPAVYPGYGIPRDNPFIGATQFNGEPVDPGSVRTEFYAVGLRNPWRFTFHPNTGKLICADVGGAEFEEIDIVEPGGNYGWPYTEGFKTIAQGATPDGLKPPIYAYAHGYDVGEGTVIIGGPVYTGSVLPGLSGKYLFGDFVTGNVWAIDPNDPQPAAQWIAARSGISSFGLDPATGEILAANHDLGIIERLVYQNPSSSGVPQNLADTGAFEDAATLRAAPTAVPFEVNAPLWSDGAAKRRWVDLSGARGKIEIGDDGAWKFPSGARWIKHFEFDSPDGSKPPRRVETRILVKTDEGIYGLSYRWNESGAEATLAPPEGLTETIRIEDATGTNDLVWTYPSWEQCRICHNPESGYVLGFNAAQVNRKGASDIEQLAAFVATGMFENPDGLAPNTAPKLAGWDDSHAPALHRVRSYLQSNCAHCHFPGGRSLTLWDARIATPLADASIVGAAGVFYPPPAKIVAPHSIDETILNIRAANRSPEFQMPPIATKRIDTRFLAALTNWVETMPREPWIVTNFGAAISEGAAEQIGRTLRLASRGGGIGEDSLLFAGRPASGAVALSARLASGPGGSSGSEAGLVLRATLEDKSILAALMVRDGFARFLAPNGEAGELKEIAATAAAYPIRLRLVQQGDRASGWIAPGGGAWQKIGEIAAAAPVSFLIGLAAASGPSAADFSAAEFEDCALQSIEVSPPSSPEIRLPADVPLSANVVADDQDGLSVDFYSGTNWIGRADRAPFDFSWANAARGDALVSAVLRQGNLSLTSAPVAFRFDAEPSEAFAMPTDYSTLGNWQGAYGAELALVPGRAAVRSGVISMTANGRENFLRTDANPAALRWQGEGIVSQLQADGALEILLEGGGHRIREGSLYFVDWLLAGLAQEIVFSDPFDGRVLMRANTRNFDGAYFRFAFRPPISIRIENPAGPAYVTGVFVDTPEPLTVELLQPAAGAVLQQPVSVEFAANAVAPQRSIDRVELWIDNELAATMLASPYRTSLATLRAGTHSVQARAFGDFGYSAATSPVEITLLPPPARALFLGADTNTSGAWKDRYGAGGYWIIGDSYTIPDWLQILPEDSYYTVHSDDSDDSAALIRAQSDTRIAHYLFGNPSFSVLAWPLDGRGTRLGFYFFDHDDSHRAIEILAEAPDGTVLDRRQVSEFSAGAYFFWEIQGEVRFRLQALSGLAVLSGLFLDPELTSAQIERNNLLPPGAGDVALDEDSDLDRISNGLELLLGYNPRNASETPKLRAIADKGNFALAFSFRRFSSDLRLKFQVSSDLVTWQSAGTPSVSVSSANGTSWMTYRFNSASSGTLFVKLGVELPPAE